MRGTVDDLESPHPIGLELPALFQDDDVALSFTAGLDTVLAPIFLTLDAIDSYVDPWIAPADFLGWVAEWVSAPWDEALPDMRQRALVAKATELLGWAGTAKGLADLIELHAGIRPEIVDSGATAWSVEPGGDMPGSAEPKVTLRVRVDELPAAGPEREDRLERVRQVAVNVLPAHVIATVEVSAA